MTTHDQAAPNGVKDIIDTALASAEVQALPDDHRFYAVPVPQGGSVDVIDIKKLEAEAERILEPYRDAPRRPTGTFTVRDVPSFAAFMAKHASVDSEVWADQRGGKITAVLDADKGLEGPAWGQHRLEYPALKTPEWLAWEKYDGAMLKQVDFAEHIEDRLTDIREPSAADMVELAQEFQATTQVNFESSNRLADGQRQLVYKETVDATVGKSGNITIPEKFYIALRPYEGSEAFKVECRFRYRMGGGQLSLGYKITQPEDILREAFDSLVSLVNDALNEESIEMKVPVLLGVAPAAR